MARCSFFAAAVSSCFLSSFFSGAAVDGFGALVVGVAGLTTVVGVITFFSGS